MTLFDETSEFGGRVLRRLHEEEIIWLTTLGRDGTPQPSPVWFMWDGETILIYSKPNAPKIANIARTSKVALHFNTDPDGNNVVVLIGTAVIDDHTPPALHVPAYVAKYAEGIARLDMDNDGFAAEYSQAIRVTPHKVRGF